MLICQEKAENERYAGRVYNLLSVAARKRQIVKQSFKEKVCKRSILSDCVCVWIKSLEYIFF